MPKKTSSLSDEALVGLICDEDQELYSELVKRYEDKLLRYALYLANSKDRAEDIVQEAFIKAFINLRGFNQKKKFSSWIYRIVHNEAINFIKKQKKEISFEENGWLEDDLRADNLKKELSSREIKKVIKEVLEKLPLIYGEPLSLFYLNERSYQEISDILKVPIGTVGTRIKRGKRLVKKIYQKKKKIYE